MARRREERAKRKAQEELERNAEENKKEKKDETEEDENVPRKAASAGRVVERTEKLKGRKPSLPVRSLLLKPLFHSLQKPTRKLAASPFKYCDWMKVLAASLGVGFCDEWKRGFIVVAFKY